MIVYNQFWIPGKVPSLNELNTSRGVQSPASNSIIRRSGTVAKKSGYRFNMYNEIKQDWSKKVCGVVKKTEHKKVESCYYTYLIIEKTRKRDPSNICASAIKFIEDGLMKAGVISNDGWDNVLGINSYWIHEKAAQAGICVFMASEPLSKLNAVSFWRKSVADSLTVNPVNCWYCGPVGTNLTIEEHQQRWGGMQLCSKHDRRPRGQEETK